MANMGRVPASVEWHLRLAARTHASHACNTGSIPVDATNKNEAVTNRSSRFFVVQHDIL